VNLADRVDYLEAECEAIRAFVAAWEKAHGMD
jgi:hypothetical protein